MTIETKALVTFEEEELDTINKARDILHQMCNAMHNCEMCPLEECCANNSESPADYLRTILIKIT